MQTQAQQLLTLKQISTHATFYINSLNSFMKYHSGYLRISVLYEIAAVIGTVCLCTWMYNRMKTWNTKGVIVPSYVQGADKVKWYHNNVFISLWRFSDFVSGLAIGISLISIFVNYFLNHKISNLENSLWVWFKGMCMSEDTQVDSTFWRTMHEINNVFDLISTHPSLLQTFMDMLVVTRKFLYYISASSYRAVIDARIMFFGIKVSVLTLLIMSNSIIWIVSEIKEIQAMVKQKLADNPDKNIAWSSQQIFGRLGIIKRTIQSTLFSISQRGFALVRGFALAMLTRIGINSNIFFLLFAKARFLKEASGRLSYFNIMYQIYADDKNKYYRVVFAILSLNSIFFSLYFIGKLAFSTHSTLYIIAETVSLWIIANQMVWGAHSFYAGASGWNDIAPTLQNVNLIGSLLVIYGLTIYGFIDVTTENVLFLNLLLVNIDNAFNIMRFTISEIVLPREDKILVNLIQVVPTCTFDNTIPVLYNIFYNLISQGFPKFTTVQLQKIMTDVGLEWTLLNAYITDPYVFGTSCIINVYSIFLNIIEAPRSIVTEYIIYRNQNKLNQSLNPGTEDRKIMTDQEIDTIHIMYQWLNLLLSYGILYGMLLLYKAGLFNFFDFAFAIGILAWLFAITSFETRCWTLISNPKDVHGEVKRQQVYATFQIMYFLFFAVTFLFSWRKIGLNLVSIAEYILPVRPVLSIMNIPNSMDFLFRWGDSSLVISVKAFARYLLDNELAQFVYTNFSKSISSHATFMETSYNMFVYTLPRVQEYGTYLMDVLAYTEKYGISALQDLPFGLKTQWYVNDVLNITVEHARWSLIGLHILFTGLFLSTYAYVYGFSHIKWNRFFYVDTISSLIVVYVNKGILVGGFSLVSLLEVLYLCRFVHILHTLKGFSIIYLQITNHIEVSLNKFIDVQSVKNYKGQVK